GGPATEYTGNTTDANGVYTVPVGSLPLGTYLIRAKGRRNLSNGSAACEQTVDLNSDPATSIDLGLMKAGDAISSGPTNFKVVNSVDFTALKATFGKAFGQPGYDDRADFNNTDNIDATDFNLLKGTFGQSGCGPAV